MLIAIHQPHYIPWLGYLDRMVKADVFIVLDHVKDFPAARAELAQWIAEGKLKKTETVVRGGLKVAEQALVDLYKGINTGKLIVEIKNHNEANYVRIGIGRAIYAFRLSHGVLPESLQVLVDGTP